MHKLGHCLTECLLCTDMSFLHEVHLTGYMPIKLSINAMAESWKVYFSAYLVWASPSVAHLGPSTVARSVEDPGIFGSIYTNGKSWDQQIFPWADTSTARASLEAFPSLKPSKT